MTDKRSPGTKPPAEAARGSREARGANASFPIVGVGASAGGLEAFAELLEHLPAHTGMAFVLVQHRDPKQESSLTELLSRATSLPVREVSNDLRVQADYVYVNAPNARLGITEGVLKVHVLAHARLPQRPIDTFFEALAEDQGSRAIGVVLSGTASDGTLGVEAIKAEGGITFAQDDSARYDFMPRSAAAADCVDFILSPQRIAQELARIAAHPYMLGQAAKLHPRAREEGNETPLPASRDEISRKSTRRARPETGLGEPAGSKRAQEDYKKILLLLRDHSGVDFSLYRSSTIQRRIVRRLVLNKWTTLEDYVRFLRDNIKELDALYSDVLISVTSFFRNPEAFDALQHNVLPELLRSSSEDALRIWVLGCSTGQEAYSLAMAFVEAAEESPRGRKLQMFATDLNDALLEKARQGFYTKSLAHDISPERLQRFFVEEEDGYRVDKTLRDMVVFARHNLISDPPFSRMDLISCRNLLIYLEPDLQKKALPTFHYSLKSGGFLLLGASESIGGFSDLFEPVDKKHKIYVKKAVTIPALFQLPLPKERDERSLPALPGEQGEVAEGVHRELDAHREADRIVLNRFAPPGVLVNEQLQVLQFRGTTEAYLTLPSGTASFDVLKMARQGLMLALCAAINQAKQDNQTARKDNVPVNRNGETRRVNVEVIPLKNLRERCFLILFTAADATLAQRRGSDQPSAPPPPLPSDDASRRIAELEAELGETRDYLQSMQEQHEAASEELQAANEEAQSANEELHSINEELETSKEEIESANEELATVNEQMVNRNAELDRTNNDLLNFQNSTRLAIVLLDRDLTIRHFTPQAEKHFELLAADIGRPISQLQHNLVVQPRAGEGPPPDLEGLIAEAITQGHEAEYEVQDKAGRWYSLRANPYLTLDNKVDGAVLVLLDIDARKCSEQAIAEARDYAQNVIETVHEPLLVLDERLRVESANRSFYGIFRVSPAETVGRFIYELGTGQWDSPRLRELLGQTLAQDASLADFQVEHDFAQLGRRTVLLNARRILDPQRGIKRILLAIEDISERKRTEGALRESEEQFRTLVAQVKDYAIFRIDPQGRAVTWNTGVEEILGFREKEFIGKNIVPLIFTPEDVEKGVPERELELATAEGVANDDRWMRRKGGSHFFAGGVTTALRNDAGKLVGFSKVMRDQTKHKRMELALHSSELRYRRLFETAKDGILILDDQSLRIMDANPAMYELLNDSLEALEGKEIWEIGLFQDRQESLDAARKLREEGYLRYDDLPLKSAHGAVREVELRGHVCQVDDRAVVQCNIRDISERKRMERQIQKQAEALAETGRRKDEFLAMLSHELRNPLAPILNALQLIQQDGDESELQGEARAVIERQMRHLARLVDDLLEISRITTGRIHLQTERVNVNAVIERAVERVRPLMDQRGQHLTLTLAPQPIWLEADCTRLEQVFGNLLDNASKYNDKGGLVTLTVEQIENEAVFRVRDDGEGIEADSLADIFELFKQAKRSLDRSQGGLGIGLALVKNVVEMHGGSVAGHSSGLGQGSEFVVRLPVASSQQPTPDTAAPPEAESLGSSPRVLIVDDNPDAAKMSAMLLRSWEHEVEVAHDGPDALEKAQAFQPHVILLDIGLPRMDGFAVARSLRQQPQFADVRIVAVTGYGQAMDRHRSKEAGFDEHLVKPVESSRLKALLAGFFPPRTEGGH